MIASKPNGATPKKSAIRFMTNLPPSALAEELSMCMGESWVMSKTPLERAVIWAFGTDRDGYRPGGDWMRAAG